MPKIQKGDIRGTSKFTNKDIEYTGIEPTVVCLRSAHSNYWRREQTLLKSRIHFVVLWKNFQKLVTAIVGHTSYKMWRQNKYTNVASMLLILILMDPMHLSMSLLTTRNSSQNVCLEVPFWPVERERSMLLSPSFTFCCWPCRNVKKDLSRLRDKLNDDVISREDILQVEEEQHPPVNTNYHYSGKKSISTMIIIIAFIP